MHSYFSNTNGKCGRNRWYSALCRWQGNLSGTYAEFDEDEICAFQVETTYNASKFEFESLEWNEKLSAFLLTYADTEWNGFHYVNYCGSTYCDYEFAAGDTFATVIYTVKADIMLSEAELDNLIVVIGYSDDVTNATHIWTYLPELK